MFPGVVTKPDLVDSGSEQEMIQVVSNEIVPLKRGFTLVKCRGQKNIKDNMSLSDAIREEEAFFSDKRNSHFRFRWLNFILFLFIPSILFTFFDKPLGAKMQIHIKNTKYKIIKFQTLNWIGRNKSVNKNWSV